MIKTHLVDLGWCMARLSLDDSRIAVEDAKLTIVSPADETETHPAYTSRTATTCTNCATSSMSTYLTRRSNRGSHHSDCR